MLVVGGVSLLCDPSILVSMHGVTVRMYVCMRVSCVFVGFDWFASSFFFSFFLIARLVTEHTKASRLGKTVNNSFFDPRPVCVFVVFAS